MARGPIIAAAKAPVKAKKKTAKKKAAKKKATKPVTRARPADELQQALADELGLSSPGTDGTGPEPNPNESGGSASPGTAAGPVPGVVSLDGWNKILISPFRGAAVLLDCPELAEVGQRGVPDLAEASHPLFVHYAGKWFAMNPDDPLAVAKAVTVALLSEMTVEVFAVIQTKRAAMLAAEKDIGKPADPTKTQPEKPAKKGKDIIASTYPQL